MEQKPNFWFDICLKNQILIIPIDLLEISKDYIREFLEEEQTGSVFPIRQVRPPLVSFMVPMNTRSVTPYVRENGILPESLSFSFTESIRIVHDMYARKNTNLSMNACVYVSIHCDASRGGSVYVKESRGARHAVHIVCAPSVRSWKVGYVEPGNAACTLTRACTGFVANWAAASMWNVNSATDHTGVHFRAFCAARAWKNSILSCAVSRRTARVFEVVCKIQNVHRQNLRAAKNGCSPLLSHAFKMYVSRHTRHGIVPDTRRGGSRQGIRCRYAHAPPRNRPSDQE
jgi:hypothetical protein